LRPSGHPEGLLSEAVASVRFDLAPDCPKLPVLGSNVTRNDTSGIGFHPVW
jgi:hypothetical protein